MGKLKGAMDFQTYARKAFESSLITSLPEIAKAKDWKKRYLKLLVFVISVIGLLYQTSEFLALYFTYPTVVDIQISNPAEIEVPGLTFCNRNKRKRTVVCEHERCLCKEYNETEEFCNNFPWYCKGDSEPYLKVAKDEAFYHPCIKQTSMWEDAYIESHGMDTIVTCLKKYGPNKEETCRSITKVPVREFSERYEYNLCYSIDSQYGQANAEQVFHPLRFEIILDLDTQPLEYLTAATPAIQIAIHDRKALTNPYFDGVPLKAGARYVAHVSKTETTYLPPPYQTLCFDYLTEWKRMSGSGPLDRLMCVEYCKMKTALKKGGCVDQTYYPNNETVCPYNGVEVREDLLIKCMNSCKNPCYEQKYEVRYEETSAYMCINESIAAIPKAFCKHERIYIQVSFKHYTLTSISYYAKFDSIELFSYIGGFIGMWIGLSLVSLFDLIQTLFHLAYYPVERHKAKQNKRTSFGEKNGRLVVY